MSENKFIKRLKGEQTAKSVLEIKNESAKTSFANMPQGTSNAINVYSDHRGNATVVANGTMNWKIDSLQTLTPANIVNGNGQDFTTSMATSGAGLWINAEYIFPSTGDPTHPVAMVFNPQTKWVLKVCGDNLLSPTKDTIDFTVLITFGSSNIISKTFTVTEQANRFCKEFVIDFAESNTNIIKAQGLSTMKLQLLCGTADASANIYGGMTVLTCLQRKVEAVAISSTFANVEEVLRDGLLPNDYFSNGAYIAQVTDGDTAYAVFQRDGDEMLFVGWHQPIPDQTGNSGKFLMTNGSLMSWKQLTISDIEELQDDLDDLQDQITTNKGTMDNHISNTSNPHQVTKAQVGLGNCDNTADLDKPISTATQTALNGKVDKNADITGATKCKITYDNKGLVTAGADLAESDIPSLHLSKISDVTASAAEVNVLDGITASTAELNILDGVTATTSEINVLDGITATTAELNYTDGVTSNIQTQLDGKQATISDLATIRSNASAGKAASDTIATYGNIVTHNVSEFATSAQGALADSALQPGDNVSDLVNDAGYLTQHQTLADLGITATASEINVLDGITASTTELNYVDGVTGAIQTQIDGKQTKSTSAYNMGNSSGGWTAMSNTQQDALNSGANTTNIGQIATNTSNIANEIIDRQNADNGLQSQIDAIVSKSDVVDIVGTYAELQAYDTSDLGNNDVVKVISDSTHNDAPSYYRWVISGGVGSWVYIGSEAETYTKAETDALLNAKQDNITATDGITLTGTTLTNSGVRAVASGTANGTISVNTNGTTADVAVTGLGSAAYTASSAYATSIQGGKADTAVQPGDLATVATTGDYDDLINKPTIPAAQVNSDWNANSGVAQILNKPTLAAVATSGSYTDLTNKPTIPAAQVNSDWDAVSGVAQILNKPTLGTMAAESASDYTKTSGLATVATSGSYTDLLNKPTIPTVNDATLTIQKNGTSVATFTANASSGVTANITVPTTTNDLTNNSGFITSSDIPVTDVTVGGTSVVTSGVAAVPSIPTVNDATITITQGGVTKGSFTLNQAGGDTIALDAGGGGGVSVGMIAPFGNLTAPAGWLICDGSAISRTNYSDLFDVIGTTYGSGDGSTTFNLPDLSGKLPLYDSGATLGNTTSGKAPNITGQINIRSEGNYSTAVKDQSGALQPIGNTSNIVRPASSGRSTWDYGIKINASNSNAVYDDNATGILPAGVYTLWCIKY